MKKITLLSLCILIAMDSNAWTIPGWQTVKRHKGKIIAATACVVGAAIYATWRRRITDDLSPEEIYVQKRRRAPNKNAIQQAVNDWMTNPNKQQFDPMAQ